MELFSRRPSSETNKAILEVEGELLGRSITSTVVEERIQELEREKLLVLRRLEKRVRSNLKPLLSTTGTSDRLLQATSGVRDEIAATVTAISHEGLGQMMDEALLVYNFELRRQRAQQVHRHLEMLRRFSQLSEQTDAPTLLQSLVSLRAERELCEQFTALADVRRQAEGRLDGLRGRLYDSIASCLDTEKHARTEDALRHYEEALRAVVNIPSEARRYAEEVASRVTQICQEKVARTEAEPVSVNGLAKLFEALTGVLLRIQHVCSWHSSCAQGKDYLQMAASRRISRVRAHDQEVFRALVQTTGDELLFHKEEIWLSIGVRLAEFLSNVTCIELSFSDFLRVIVLFDRLLRVGESFVSPLSRDRHLPLQYPSGKAVASALRTVTFDYFRCLHVEKLKMLQESLGSDAWHRLPVTLSHRLLSLEPILPSPLQPPTQPRDGVTSGPNPFKGFTPASAWPTPPLPKTMSPNELDERVASLSENSRPHADAGPCLSNVTKQAANVIQQYWTFLTFMPLLAFEVFVAIQHVVDMYMYSVARLFIPAEDLRRFQSVYIPSEDFICGKKLQACHRAFLMQRGRLRFKAFMNRRLAPSSLTSPLGELTRTLSSYGITTFPALNSAGALYGLPEIAVGAESCRLLLKELTARMVPSGKDVLHPHEADTGTQFFMMISPQQQKTVIEYFQETDAVITEMTDVMLSSLAVKLGDFSGLLRRSRNGTSQAHFTSMANEWELHLRDVAIKASYAGGGAVPNHVLSAVWAQGEESFWRASVDFVSRGESSENTCEAVHILFAKYREVFRRWLPDTTEYTNDEPPLKVRLMSRPRVNQAHFEAYVAARELSAQALVQWCKQQSDYNVLHLLQLVQMSTDDGFERGQARDELELWYAELLKIA